MFLILILFCNKVNILENEIKYLKEEDKVEIIIECKSNHTLLEKSIISIIKILYDILQEKKNMYYILKVDTRRSYYN